MRKNLRHEQLDYPFYYLDPAFKRNDWWDKKLHYLIEHFDRIGYDGRKLVARSVLNVAYFPYPSRNFGHLCIPLDAQKYGFSLVREALERDAVIIHMRRADIWEPKVQGLSECKRRFQVPNTQTPVITPHCPGFKEAIEAIKTFAATPAASK
jgi:hypothetical protein